MRIRPEHRTGNEVELLTFDLEKNEHKYRAREGAVPVHIVVKLRSVFPSDV